MNEPFVSSHKTCFVLPVSGSHKYLGFHFLSDFSCSLGRFEKNEDHKGSEEGDDA